jgi:hypothetical protein
VPPSALTESASSITSVIGGVIDYFRAWAIRIVGRDIVVLARLARDVQAAVDISHFEQLIPQKHLLPIPRPGRHSHFSVSQPLDTIVTLSLVAKTSKKLRTEVSLPWAGDTVIEFDTSGASEALEKMPCEER